MNKIKKIRILNEESQAVLADALGVTVVTIGNWEHDKSSPKLYMAVKIAEHYNVDISELV